LLAIASSFFNMADPEDAGSALEVVAFATKGVLKD